MNRPDRVMSLILLCVGLLLVSLLVMRQLSTPLWADEDRTLHTIGAAPQYGTIDYATVVQRLVEDPWQAPLYYSVLWVWGHLAGWSFEALRLPSLFAGLLALAGIFALMRRLYDVQTGRTAVFLLATSLFFLHYLSELRPYSLMVLMTVALIAAYLWLQVPARRSLWVRASVLALVVALALYTHYFMAFPIVGLGLVHLLRWRLPHFRAGLLAFLAGGALFLPYTTVLIEGMRRAEEVERAFLNLSAGDALLLPVEFFSNGSAGLLLLPLVLAFVQRHRPTRLLVGWLLFTALALVILTRIVPALTELKYTIFWWVPLALLAAAGIRHMPAPIARTFLLVWSIVWIGTGGDTSFRQRVDPWYAPDLKGLAHDLMPVTQPDDHVLFVGPYNTFFAEETLLEFAFYGDDAHDVEIISDTYTMTDAFLLDQVRQAADGADRVWLTYEQAVRNWRMGMIETDVFAAEGWADCGTVPGNQPMAATLYQRPVLTSDALTFTSDTGDTASVALTAPLRVQENRLAIQMAWSLSAALPLSAAVHLDDANGTFVAGQDIGLTPDTFGCALSSLALDELPVGDYSAYLVVYDWQTGERLTTQATTRLPIGTIRRGEWR